MFVGADAERSCSRRRSVTDAACPSRVLIGPLLQFCIALSFLNVGADDSVRPPKAPSASEEACCIPFPPGRRKLHIRWLLLPFQTVTVSLGHNLAIWNFTTPHAILMMAVISLPANTAKSKTSMRRKSRARLWSIEGVRGNHPKGFPGRLFLFLAARHGSFLSPNRERKEWGRKTPLALHFPPCVLQ